MTHRLLGACLGAVLLGTPGLASRCLAKPPDLPAKQPIFITPPKTTDRPTGPSVEGVWVDLSKGEVPGPVQDRSWSPPTPRKGIPLQGDPTCDEGSAAAHKVRPHPSVRRKLAVPLLMAIYPFASLLGEEECEVSANPSEPERLSLLPVAQRPSCCPKEIAITTEVQEDSDVQILLDAFDRLFSSIRQVFASGLDLACPLVQHRPPLSSSLLSTSEELRAIESNWQRIWVSPPPSEFVSPPARVLSQREVLLNTPMSLNYTKVPLQVVLEELRDCQIVPVLVDLPALRDKGTALGQPITLKAEQIPFRVGVDLVVRQAGLECVDYNGCLVITCAKQGLPEGGSPQGEEESSVGKKEGEVCPRAQALHRLKGRQGIDEQVAGLMKACHAALAEGQHEKAADLARQARALDPERVDADPVVYKLHLLSGVKMPGKQEECEAEICPASRPSTGGPSNDVRPMPTKAPKGRSEVLQLPSPPPLDPNLVAALDSLLPEAAKALVEQDEFLGQTPCPTASLVSTVQEWVEAFAHGQGTFTLGVDFFGLNVHAWSRLNGQVYHAMITGKTPVFWTTADTGKTSQ